VYASGEPKRVGAVAVSSVASFCPQPLQKRLPGALVCPQAWQAPTSAAPQALQNRAPVGLSRWHCGQRIPGGVEAAIRSLP
jgi:hypothetical protein